MEKINTKLTQDPRYSAALAKLNELRVTHSEIETQISEAESALVEISELKAGINMEARALLYGTTEIGQSSEDGRKTIDQLKHKSRVVLEAIQMQEAIVTNLGGEIGTSIITKLLPTFKENTAAIVQASIQLHLAIKADFDLRTELLQNGVSTGRFQNIVGDRLVMERFLPYDRQAFVYKYIAEAIGSGLIEVGAVHPSYRPLGASSVQH